MKPILFNTEMVRAILCKRKSVTRRDAFQVFKKDAQYRGLFKDEKGKLLAAFSLPDGTDVNEYSRYQPGDILYVRETWQCFNPYSEKEYVYKASNDCSDIDGMKWLPSIYMPKEAARIFLKVTNIKVERLQDITEEQAMSEGIKCYSKDGKLIKYAVNDDWWINYHRKHRREFDGNWWQDMPRSAKEAFQYLWNSTVKKQDLYRYGWKANPWVWIYELEQCEKPKDLAERNRWGLKWEK